MGICPCARDRDDSVPLPPAPLLSLEEDTLSGTRGEAQEEQLHVTLRAKETIIRLVGPLTSRYQRGNSLVCDGGVEVFRATYLATGQDCVITQIPKQIYRSAKKAKSELFARLTKLDHPYVLKTYEVCQDNLHLYIVSESYYCTLCEYITEVGRMSQVQAATAIEQVWSALAYCHNNGFVHGRVSMQSVVLKHPPKRERVTLKLTEFYRLGNASFEKSIFSPPQPEMPSEKTDVYSTGVILYILLSGRNPFERYKTTKVLTCKGVSFPPTVWESVSQDAVKLIVTVLSERPEKRPSAMQCVTSLWVQKFTFEGSLASESVQLSAKRLRRRQEYASLKEAVMQFIITRIMQDSEIAKLAKHFSTLDTNSDGLISRDELLNCFRVVMAEGDAEREAQKVIAKADRNGNGVIDYSEFLISAFEEKRLLNKDSLRAAFATLDRDGNGRISIQELKHFFRLNSSPGSYHQWRQLIAEFDTSGDGEIDFSEFETMMLAAFHGA